MIEDEILLDILKVIERPSNAMECASPQGREFRLYEIKDLILKYYNEIENDK